MAKLYPISTAHNHDEVYAKIGESGVTDHGALTGLEDNDHPQYLLTTGKAADADKLDAMGAVGIARTFMRAGEHNGSVHDGIGHFRDKLLKLPDLMYTGTARRIAGERSAFLVRFLEVLEDEMSVSQD